MAEEKNTHCVRRRSEEKEQVYNSTSMQPTQGMQRFFVLAKYNDNDAGNYLIKTSVADRIF